MINKFDIEYANVVGRVLDNGTKRMDRTGVGTIADFGFQMRFDVGKQFPMLTTKKVHWKSIVTELLWFISGDTNIRYLEENGVTIWREWADQDGFLGPIYGSQWVSWGAKREKVMQREPQLPTGIEATYLGVGNGQGKGDHPLGKTWEGMMSRCYDKESVGYKTYGAKGVSVCDDWLVFKNFARDAVLLPGYEDKVKSKVRYVLDKDTRGSGFLYGPKSCMWITDEDNALAKTSGKFYTVEDREGKQHTFTNPTVFCRDQGISNKNFSDLWTGRKNAKVRNGFRLISVEDQNRGVNQLSNLLYGLRNDPFSRRHIVSAWNVTELDKMALAPCHMMFQCFVSEGESGTKRLSMQVYQRSADLFLGVPFNIPSYALLLSMIAQQVDMEPHHLVYVLGDTHIYLNHMDQISEQLSRSPISNTLQLNLRKAQSIDGYTLDDIELLGYNHHPAIKAPVAV